MGFTEVLTIIFVVLKLLGKIDWSWWLVLLPEIIGLAIYLVIVIASVTKVSFTNRQIKKHFKSVFKED